MLRQRLITRGSVVMRGLDTVDVGLGSVGLGRLVAMWDLYAVPGGEWMVTRSSNSKVRKLARSC